MISSNSFVLSPTLPKTRSIRLPPEGQRVERARTWRQRWPVWPRCDMLVDRRRHFGNDKQARHAFIVAHGNRPRADRAQDFVLDLP